MEQPGWKCSKCRFQKNFAGYKSDAGCIHTVQGVKTWDLENEVVGNRVASPALLNDHTGKEIIVVNGNGSMIVDYQCRSRVRYLLQPVDFITCSTG